MLNRVVAVVLGVMLLGIVSATPAEALDPPEIVRYAGADRADTAAKVALDLSATSAAFQRDVVVLVRQDDFADGLAAAYLAGLMDAPVLLTGRDAMPPATLDALQQLQPRTAYVIGGRAVISDASLESLPDGTEISRIAGATRHETAAAIARFSTTTLEHRPSTIILAAADRFADALVAGPWAAAEQAPLLLTDSDRLPDTTRELLREIRPARVVVIGGEGVISSSVVNEIEDLGLFSLRLGGATRYETSTLVAETLAREFGWQRGHAILATGTNFADSLAAGAFAANSFSGPAPLLLTDPEIIPPALDRYLDDIGACEGLHVHVIGGEAAISNDVAAEVAARLTPPGTCLTNRFDEPVVTSRGFAQTMIPEDQVAVVSGIIEDPPTGIHSVRVIDQDTGVATRAELDPSLGRDIGWRAELSFDTGGAQRLTVEALDAAGRIRSSETTVRVDVPEGNETVLSPDVRRFDEAARTALIAGAPDGQWLDLDPGAAPFFRRGEVLVPDDLLTGEVTELRRRLDLVEHRPDGTLRLHGSPARITDVVVNGDLVATAEAGKAEQQTNEFALDIDASFRTDLDANLGPLGISGELNFAANVNFEVNIRWETRFLLPVPRVEYATASVSGDQSLELDVSGDGGSIDRTKRVFERTLPSLSFWPGGVYVLIEPEVEVDLFARGSFGLEALSVRQSAYARLGFEWTPEGGGRGLNQFNYNMSIEPPSHLTASGELEVGVNIEVEFKLYRIDGMEVFVELFAFAEAEATSTGGEFEIGFGVSAGVGFDFDIPLLDYEIDFNAELLGYRHTWLEGSIGGETQSDRPEGAGEPPPTGSGSPEGGSSPPINEAPAPSGPVAFRVTPATCGNNECNSAATGQRGVSSNFTPGGTVDISITIPDGRDGNAAGGPYAYIPTASVRGDGTFTWLYYWEPGMALGTYRTTVTDVETGRSASADFTYVQGGGADPGTPDAPAPGDVTVTAAVGGSAQGQPQCSSSACRYLLGSGSGFGAGASVSVACQGNDGSGWSTFFSTTKTASSSGDVSHNTCYYGFPGDRVRIVMGGVASNTLTWPGSGGGSTPPPTTSAAVSISKGPSAQGQPGCSSSFCQYIHATGTGFAGGTSVSVSCQHNDGSGWGTFYSTTRNASSSGQVTHNTCYYGFPGNRVRVVMDGVGSNVITW